MCSLVPRYGPSVRSTLIIVDNQGWLFGAIDVEFGNLPLHLDLELCSLPRDEVDNRTRIGPGVSLRNLSQEILESGFRSI